MANVPPFAAVKIIPTDSDVVPALSPKVPGAKVVPSFWYKVRLFNTSIASDECAYVVLPAISVTVKQILSPAVVVISSRRV